MLFSPLATLKRFGLLSANVAEGSHGPASDVPNLYTMPGLVGMMN